MGRIFAVVSGKGGTGKSTVSVGLAAALSDFGQRVLVIDLDTGLRCLDMLLGVEKDVVFDLGDVFAGKEISDVIYDVPYLNGVQMIPAPQNVANIPPMGFCQLLDTLSAGYDVILLDFPAGIDIGMMSVLSKRVDFITVCTPDPISVRDAAAVYSTFSDIDVSLRLIINKFSSDNIQKGLAINIDDVIDRTGIRLIGIVPQSSELALLSMKHEISKKGRAAKAFVRIAKRLMGADVRLPDPKKI